MFIQKTHIHTLMAQNGGELMSWSPSVTVALIWIPVFSVLLSILLSCSNIATDSMLYSDAEIEKSMDKIETVNFHQVHH